MRSSDCERRNQFADVAQYLLQWQSEEFAVIQIAKSEAASRDHRSTVDGEAELIRPQREILPEFQAAAVRKFGDIVKAEPTQIIDHSTCGHARYDDLGGGVEERLQRRSVEMIPMQVGQINIGGRNILYQRRVGLGKIPPTSPIARAEQPRIADHADAVVLNVQPRMTQDGKFQAMRPIDPDRVFNRRKVMRM